MRHFFMSFYRSRNTGRWLCHTLPSIFFFLSLATLSAAPLDIPAYNNLMRMGLEKATVCQKSPFSKVCILDSPPYRGLMFDDEKFIQSVYNTKDSKDLPLRYTQVIPIALLYPEKVTKILQIGLGGGQISTYITQHMPEVELITVDVNPVVVEFAQKYMGYVQNSSQHVIVADGLDVLKNPSAFGAPPSYDVIILDAFGSSGPPPHLTGGSFYETLKKRIAPSGVLIQNVVRERRKTLTELRQHFEHVDIFNARSNFLVVAYDGPKRDLKTITMRAVASQKKYQWTHSIADTLRWAFVAPKDVEELLTHYDKDS